MTKPRPMWRLALALALAAGSALAQPPIWRVTGAKGSAILFGSVHSLPTGLDWRPKRLTEAVAKASEIWFEIPIGGQDDAKAVDLLFAKGELSRGDTLAAHLSPSMLRRLDDDARALGVPPEALTGMKPWLADATLSVAADARAGALTSEGVERQISAIAPAGTPRRALETPAAQVAALARGTMREQIDLLAISLDEIEREPKSYETLLDAWMRADLVAMEREALAPLRSTSPRAYRALIIDRNQKWAREIEHRLDGSGDIVVIVGVGHLIGPDALPQLLSRRGLRVDGP